MLRRPLYHLAVILAVAGAVLPLAGRAAQPEPAGALQELWIDVGMGPPLVEWFNQVARPDDLARVGPWELALLDGIRAGRRLVVFVSVRDAEQFLPLHADKIDVVGYNLEHGTAPPEERDDPVGSVQRMHDLARAYCKPLALGPDHTYTERAGVQMAPYVDIFVLQVQRVQDQPETVLEYVGRMAPALRQANPDLQISVQVGGTGVPGARDVTVDELVSLLDGLKEHLDGVSILTNPDYVDETRELVARLRAEAGGEIGAASGSNVDQPYRTYIPLLLAPQSQACS